MSIKRRKIVALLGGILVVGLLVMATKSAREEMNQSVCKSRMFQINFALNTYRHYYGCFPPPFTTNAAGERMHSWRVLLLPFLEGNQLYSRFSFTEPWNSEGNRQLEEGEKYAVDRYGCPTDQSRRKEWTNFVYVTNPVDPDEWPRRSSWFEPFMVTELWDSGISWTEPRDLTTADILGVQEPGRVRFSGNLPNSIHILSFDSTTPGLHRTTIANIRSDLRAALSDQDAPHPDWERRWRDRVVKTLLVRVTSSDEKEYRQGAILLLGEIGEASPQVVAALEKVIAEDNSALSRLAKSVLVKLQLNRAVD